MTPRYSIIMPLYNKAPYVRKALESVSVQTYRAFELIIIDDGSTDESLNIVNDFVRKSERMKELTKERVCVISQPNSGVAAARNRGVKERRGEYLCFLDADDWWEPTFLEEMDKLIQEYPDAGLYATNYVYYKTGKTHVALKFKRGYMNYSEAYLHSDAMPVWTGAVCMPRKVFDEMGGFPVGIKLGEDFLLWAKTALHYKIAFCEKALAYYNNDVPASLRATRNLHKTEHHMLFHLDEIEQEIAPLQDRERQADWRMLLDKLRISGLLDYWLSDEYHAAAEAELAKVDWTKQPKSAKAQYEMPIWWLRLKRNFMHFSSAIKQRIIRIV